MVMSKYLGLKPKMKFYYKYNRNHMQTLMRTTGKITFNKHCFKMKNSKHLPVGSPPPFGDRFVQNIE